MYYSRCFIPFSAYYAGRLVVYSVVWCPEGQAYVLTAGIGMVVHYSAHFLDYHIDV